MKVRKFTATNEWLTRLNLFSTNRSSSKRRKKSISRGTSELIVRILPEINKVRSLCQKFEEIFSKSAKDLGFKDQIEHQIKLKPDAKSYGQVHGNMWFDKSNEKNSGRTSWSWFDYSNTFRLGCSEKTVPQKGWNISFGWRLPWI